MIRRILLLATLLVAFTAGPALAQYVPGQPGFIIDPTEGYPGDSISVSGQGCPPASTVIFTIDGQVIGELIASNDPDGTFTGTLIAPDLPPGTYTIVATCGQIVMSNSFTMLAIETGSLPITGSDPFQIARWGLLLVAAGGLLLIGVRGTRSSSRAHARSGS